MLPIGAIHTICRVSSVLDKNVTKSSAQHGDIQTKRSPHDRYRIDADSSLNSACDPWDSAYHDLEQCVLSQN